MEPTERIVVVFCHGGSLNKRIWIPIRRRLKASGVLQRVNGSTAAFDWRFHGSKAGDDGMTTFFYEDGDERCPRVEHMIKYWPDWAPEDLLTYIKMLQHQDVSLNRVTRIVGVGHSMGASSMLQVEVSHPGTFAGLVLFEPTFTIDGDATRVKEMANVMVANTLARVEKWNSWEEVVDHFTSAKAFRRWHPESLKAFLPATIKKSDGPDGTEYELAMPLTQEAAMYCHRMLDFSLEQFARVQCPVVFEYGDQTRLFNSAAACAIAKALPHQFSVGDPIKGTTHWLVMEDPDMCAARLVSNLQKLPLFRRPRESVGLAASRL